MPLSVPTAVVRMLLAVVLAILLAAFVVVSYHSGCAGDLKGGSLGDIYQAQAFESQAMFCLALSIVLSLVLVGSFRSIPARDRATWAAGLIVIGTPALWLLGLEAAAHGIRNCF